jgi:GT2 family glycosyltransferase
MEHEGSEPLVSIAVVTYNSSRYVLDTLQSAKAQTYTNVELIVSDDCSTDNTVAICKGWIKDNGHRFVNARVLEAAQNAGIAGNCNRAMRASRGEWLKLIAGDDLLDEACIEEFVSEARVRTERFFACGLQQFGSGDQRLLFDHRFSKGTWEQQQNYLLRHEVFPLGPGWFFRLDALLELGGFDEAYPMLEDLPLAFRIFEKQYRVGILNKPLVRYRVHGHSITQAASSFSASLRRYQREKLVPLQIKHAAWLSAWHTLIVLWVVAPHRHAFFKQRWVHRLISLADPLSYRNKLSKVVAWLKRS